LENTKVVLHHFGSDYYFDKVWIQGKNYGYEFPMPDSLKAREKESLTPVSVAARYEATPPAAATSTEANAAVSDNTPAESNTVIAQNTTPAPAPAPAAEPAPAPAPEQNTADRDEPQTLPSTSADWLMMLLSGGTLSGAGLLLRRKG